MSKHKRHECFCCGEIFESEISIDPLIISELYDAIWFRATGNYGSSLFDPMSESAEEILQIVICDNCIRKNANRVTRIYNIERRIISKSEEFKL